MILVSLQTNRVILKTKLVTQILFDENNYISPCFVYVCPSFVSSASSPHSFCFW